MHNIQTTRVSCLFFVATIKSSEKKNVRSTVFGEVLRCEATFVWGSL